MRGHVEPHLKDIRNGNTLAQDGGTEDGLAESWDTNIDIRCAFCPFGRKPQARQYLPVQIFNVKG